MILHALYGFFCFSFQISMSMIPEAINYQEDRTGIRTDGLAYAATSLSTKVGNAFGSAMTLLVTGAFGYVANAQQTAEAMEGINLATNLVVGICHLLALIPLAFYRLTQRKMPRSRRVWTRRGRYISLRWQKNRMERCRQMKPYAFGVDIGGTTVKIGLFETEGNLLEKWEIPTRTEEDGRQIIPDIAEAVNEKMKVRGMTPEDVQGIGIGVPGPVLNESIVNRCVNLGWGVLDVAKEMSRLTGVENTAAGNDANVAALGEMWKGAGEGHENVVMITLGTGVGGGIILNGKIVSGIHGAAGEIGHIKVSEDEVLPCGCGKKGHLEQYASATGIVRKAKELLLDPAKQSSLRDLETVTAKDVFDAARNGDGLAEEVVRFSCRTLGQAMSYIADVIDPEVFVIGGGVSRAGEILLDTVKKYYREAVFHASENTEIALAKCGNDAGMYGAVKMILP